MLRKLSQPRGGKPQSQFLLSFSVSISHGEELVIDTSTGYLKFSGEPSPEGPDSPPSVPARRAPRLTHDAKGHTRFLGHSVPFRASRELNLP